MRRQLAFFLDYLLLYSLSWTVFLLSLALTQAGQAFSPAAIQAFVCSTTWRVLNWLVLPLLLTFKDGFAGYSLFKFFLDLRVVDRNTREPIGFGQSFRRNLITMVPYLGKLLCFTTMRKGRRIGDFWANTEVIWTKQSHKRPFEPRANICHDCGYDLTGNVTGRCSECGRPVNSPG